MKTYDKSRLFIACTLSAFIGFASSYKLGREHGERQWNNGVRFGMKMKEFDYLLQEIAKNHAEKD